MSLQWPYIDFVVSQEIRRGPGPSRELATYLNKIINMIQIDGE